MIAQEDSTADANAVKDQAINLQMPKNIKVADYGYDLKLDGCVPNPMTNLALKKSFLGVYAASAIFDVNIYKGFFVGAGVQNELLTTPNNKAASFVMYMEMNNTIGKIGYVQQVGDIVFFSYALNVGYNWTKYTSVTVPSGTKMTHNYTYNNSLVGAEATIYLLLQDHFAIGFNAAFNVMNNAFDPSFVYLDQYRAYDPGDNHGITSYLNVGFGLYYGFHKKKS